MGWGNVWADFDNDGYQDIYVSNDYHFTPIDNALYRNTGHGFEDVSDGDPCNNPHGGYATVASDLNDDGQIDLLIANSGAPGVVLLENTSPAAHHYIAFHLEGVESNRDAIGARIELHTPSGTQYDQVISNSGFASHNRRWIHFGLGEEDQIDKVKIKWPSGQEQEIHQLFVDTKYRIREGEGVITSIGQQHSYTSLCHSFNSGHQIIITHPFDKMEKVVLCDSSGKGVSGVWKKEENQIKISIEMLTAGIYFAQLVGKTGVCVTPILIK